MTRNIGKCSVGQVMYSPWCDDHGKVIDDGTIARLGPQHFRVTAAEPNLAWFQDCTIGFEVEIEDVSEALAALAIQGPNARRVLEAVLSDIEVEGGLKRLKYYRLTQARTPGFPLTVTRTGFTGDLGYELWAAPEHAGELWDLLMEKGQGYGISPAGMVALDIARIEAGLLLISIDYISARRAAIEAQKSSPFELGLDWAVDLTKESFIGRRALTAERAAGSKWAFVGLEVDWVSMEKLFGEVNLVPQVAGRASRQAVPVYAGGGRLRMRQVGQATSHTFSPILKKYIALASLERPYAKPGNRVKFEITVEYNRLQAEATVMELPFFNPPRKRAL
jgi:aminomethyltransferase